MILDGMIIQNGVYAAVGKIDKSKQLKVGENFTAGNTNIYIWIPRFAKNGNNIQYLYGSSDYKIVLNNDTTKKVVSYGVQYSGTINFDSNPVTYDGGYTVFGGASIKTVGGFWYKLSGESNTEVTNSAKNLNAAVKATNVTLP